MGYESGKLNIGGHNENCMGTKQTNKKDEGAHSTCPGHYHLHKERSYTLKIRDSTKTVQKSLLLLI